MKNVDLYLIHNPHFVKDLEADWAEFEKIKESGLSKYVRALVQCLVKLTHHM